MITFHVFEETVTDTYMVLPLSSQLSTQELQAVTGGWCSGTDNDEPGV